MYFHSSPIPFNLIDFRRVIFRLVRIYLMTINNIIAPTRSAIAAEGGEVSWGHGEDREDGVDEKEQESDMSGEDCFLHCIQINSARYLVLVPSG
jgi:hypothetical protein